MKLNRWTLALAAAGLVTLPSLARADAQPPNSLLTGIASTTLSGYVDTSAQWNFGTGNANNPPYSFGGAGKADGFNLDVVDVSLDKPLDGSEWAAGYHVDLWFGPDADFLFTQSTGIAADFAVHQAYVVLHTPIGNGIDWKLGVFDTIIGYESFTSINNPHYTRSYGFTTEPTQHTGLLGTYVINDQFTVNAGVADTVGPTINGRATSETYKTYMGTLAFTAPTNWGWASGSTLTAGVVNGFNANSGAGVDTHQTSVYAGAVLATPVTGLKFGLTMDYLDQHNYNFPVGNGKTWSWGLYGSYQATEKLAFNLRGEYVENRSQVFAFANANFNPNNLYEITATAQYDLWKNVISRVEFRWDHSEHGPAFGGTVAGTPTRTDAYLLAANLIYKF